MRKKILLTLGLLASVIMMAQTVTKTRQGVKFTNGDMNVELQAYSPSIIRVVKSVQSQPKQTESMAVVMKPEAVKTVVKETERVVTLSTPLIAAAIDKQNGAVTFTSVKGNVQLLAEKGGSTWQMRGEGPDKDSYIAGQTFTLDADEPIYGLGILQEEKLNKRGTKRMMIQSNLEDFVPFVQSLKGWGLYWDNTSPTLFEDNADGMTFRSDVADVVDYYFMLGGSVDGVNAQMRVLTGEVPMLPKWTYGFWQSKERYKSFAELQEVVDKYRELQIPLDCIVQDWQYWGSNYLWNAMEFLTSDFTNPKETIDRLHEKNAKVLITIWSSFGPQTKQFRELEPKGLLFKNVRTWPDSGIGDFWPPRMDYPSGVRLYDCYSDEARDIYWNHLRRLYDLGIDAWWMDSTDPDHSDFKDSDFDTPTAMGSWRRVRNAFPLRCVEGVYQHQRATADAMSSADDASKLTARPDRRVTIMTRSVFAGQQRTGANTWSGDVPSSWESLRKQIPAGLNFSMTGNPNFNSDGGGFFAGAYNKGYLDDSGCKNPLYQELYVRWIQFALFNPIMRSHGTEVSREFYKFGAPGEPAYDALVNAVRFRYTLIPYIYSMAHDVTANHGSYMRALVCDFANDKKTWDMASEYMFGKSLLVAPIVHAQYTPEKRVAVDPMSGWDRKEGSTNDGLKIEDFTVQKSHQVYLPLGTVWYDYFSDKTYDGGQTITIPSSLQTIPLFVRAGSILPVGETMQYVDERPADNLLVKVYPGSDADFTLYEDEGDSYNYEKGQFSTIAMHWNDRTRTLTIDSRQGSFPGMLQNRTFRVQIAGQKDVKSVQYSGKRVSIK